MGVRLLSGWWLIVAVPSLLTFAGCGGGGSSDTNELKDLRVEARDALEWPYANDAEVEAIIGGAFAIAARNAGTPLGDDAFDFAEELFFSHRWNDGAPSDSYVDRVPGPGWR